MTKHYIDPEIQKFFDQPGINKSGICQEAGLKGGSRFLNMMLDGTQRMTEATKLKLFPVMSSKGFRHKGYSITQDEKTGMYIVDGPGNVIRTEEKNGIMTHLLEHDRYLMSEFELIEFFKDRK